MCRRQSVPRIVSTILLGKNLVFYQLKIKLYEKADSELTVKPPYKGEAIPATALRK